MDDEQDQPSDGEALLNRAWFEAIDELRGIIGLSDDVKARIEAADVLLRYFVSLGQSINDPFIPDTYSEEVIEDDD